LSVLNASVHILRRCCGKQRASEVSHRGTEKTENDRQ